MIVAADIHLREETEKTVFNEVLPGLQMATLQDPDRTLAILGDFYHIRYRVSVALQNRVLDFLERLTAKNAATVILLPGNHDQINPEGENALEVFRQVPNVRVYTDMMDDEWGRWIPYRKEPMVLATALHQPATGIAGRVLWMHHGIKGAWMNDNRQDEEGLPLGMFQNWLRVLCGHYHKRQTTGNVSYIGSPYQTRADEAGQDKGYAIWNSENLELQWVTMKWGKRYHYVDIEKDGGIVLEDADKFDEIRVTVPAGMDSQAIGKQFAERGYMNVVVTEAVQASQARLDVQAGAGVREYASAYAQQFSGNLQSDRLMQVYDEIVGSES